MGHTRLVQETRTKVVVFEREVEIWEDPGSYQADRERSSVLYLESVFVNLVVVNFEIVKLEL